MDKLICLMVAGRGLAPRTLFGLAAFSAAMIRSGAREDLFTDSSFTCCLQTAFEMRSVGSFAGVEFTAEIQAGAHRTQVRFLVDPDAAEFEALSWRDGMGN